MPRESGYFEEAMALCQISNDNVSELVDRLYWTMLEEYEQHGLVPADNFNILNFMQAVVRVWLSVRPDVSLNETTFPPKCEPINGVKWPQANACLNAFAIAFVQLVKADSVHSGDDFDVAYALRIIGLLLDDQGEFRSCRPKEEFDLDAWLSGFVADEP